MGPYKADGMGIVHHHHGVVLIRQIADPLQIGNNSVHGKNAVGGNQLDTGPCRIRRLQLRLQIRHVIVFVAVAFCLAKPHAVDNRSMIQFVGNHRILFPQQGFKQAAVGIEAGGIQDCILRFQEMTDFFFQLLVDILGAADKPD